MNVLEGWGFVAIIAASTIGGYLLGASLKTFYEGSHEPRWITSVSIALSSACCIGGTWFAISQMPT